MPSNDQHIDVMYVSKADTLDDLMCWMEWYKGKKRSMIWFWKGKQPQDLEKYYRDFFCEWKKYKRINFHGDWLDDLTMTIEDCHISWDDLLIIEGKSYDGFIFNEI